MTDTADLVKRVRDLLGDPTEGYSTPLAMQLSYMAQYWEEYTPKLLAALSAAQARADKLEEELAKAKRERDEARGIMPSKVWNEIFEAPANFMTGHGKHYYANHQIVREAHQRAKEQCPLAADVIMAQAFFQAVASEREEIAWKEVLDERARADKLEAELAKAKNITAMLCDNNRELVGMLGDANNRAEAAKKVAENLGEMARQRADELISAEASLAAAKERVKELEEALKPFAAKADLYEANHPTSRHPLRDATQITHRLGDFRAARTALKTAAQEGK